MFWDKEKECMAREDLEQVQLERLQSTLYRVGTHVPFYRNKFSEMKLNYESFDSLDDLRQLPLSGLCHLKANIVFLVGPIDANNRCKLREFHLHISSPKC